MFRAYYCDEFELPLPPKHRFPMAKYRLLRERLLASGIVDAEQLMVPSAATDLQLSLAHDPEYIRRVTLGMLSAQEVKRMGFPWSKELVERSRRSTGATIEAARFASQMGIAANLAGGTHHAHRQIAEGYCVFNDTAVAARVLQQENVIQRALIMDCDVHQGNGTANIFSNDPSVFTTSLHGAKNFPLRKSKSDLDIDLPDGTADEVYLERLETALSESLHRATPDMVFYLAGADPYVGDRLGRMALTKPGLQARDRMVISACRDRSIPVVIVMAGGYAHCVDDIVDIHSNTIEIAKLLSR